MTSTSQQNSSWKDRHSVETSFRPRMSLVSLCYSVLLNLIWQKVHCNYFHILFDQHSIAQNFISAQQFRKEGQNSVIGQSLKSKLSIEYNFLGWMSTSGKRLFQSNFLPVLSTASLETIFDLETISSDVQRAHFCYHEIILTKQSTAKHFRIQY